MSQGQDEAQHLLRVGEGVAVALTDLGHPIANGLRVHVQLGGDGIATPLVEQPGAQGVGEPVDGVGGQAGQRREGLRAQVGEGVGVGGEQELGKVPVGVQRRGMGWPRKGQAPDGTTVGDAGLRPGPGGADDGGLPGQGSQQGAPGLVRVRDQDDGLAGAGLFSGGPPGANGSIFAFAQLRGC